MGETIVVAISICFITDSKKKMFYLHTRNILTVASAEPGKDGNNFTLSYSFAH